MIKYHKVTWKYTLDETYSHLLHFDTGVKVSKPYYEIDGKLLIIRVGYSWDGASGPTVDTEDSMRGSLVHDTLYQAIREGCIKSSFRRKSDRELSKILKSEGMARLRRWYWRVGVRLFGRKFGL